ncbi:670_t:CDS:2 [Paraglomus brasilianum]|uniref:670_t:CDS:1 n=1 Tax=Paraglomus brasilianum TaxID=144538 RepID=A0A9N8Z968_9GLOM|nr:670_t:CDS:2 [Paraglomus brasilianum]
MSSDSSYQQQYPARFPPQPEPSVCYQNPNAPNYDNSTKSAPASQQQSLGYYPQNPNYDNSTKSAPASQQQSPGYYPQNPYYDNSTKSAPASQQQSPGYYPQTPNYVNSTKSAPASRQQSPAYYPQNPNAPNYVNSTMSAPGYYPRNPNAPTYVKSTMSAPGYYPQNPNAPNYVNSTMSAPGYYPQNPNAPNYVNSTMSAPDYYPQNPNAPNYVNSTMSAPASQHASPRHASPSTGYGLDKSYYDLQETENVAYTPSPPFLGREPLNKNYPLETKNDSDVTTTNGKLATSIQLSPNVTTTNGKPVSTQPPQPVQAGELLDKNCPQEIDAPTQALSPNVTTTNIMSATTQPPLSHAALFLLRNLNPDTVRPQRHSGRFSNLRPMGNFGQCEECFSSRTGYNYCNYCNSELFQNNFSNWTSGSEEIDNFIQEAQLEATNVRSVLEWIDYKEFTNVEHLANGGNSSVFTAYWPRGPIRTLDANANEWKRGWGQANPDLGAYHKFSTLVSHVVRCYGISRCPSTNEFIVVTSYAEDGDLRQYISKNFDSFTLQRKIITLRDIASGLVTIHKVGLLHKDLHTGNILRSGTWTMISDLGLCWNKASMTENEKTIQGVLPYVAPEVLRRMPYTRATDVYSVGMIMYELWSGRPPFEGKDYDVHLAVDICSGTRPDIPPDMPAYYSIIMQACWDQDPDMRPTSRELERTFDSWIENIANGELRCPKTFANKKSVNSAKQKNEFGLHSIPERSTSQPIPPLSADQHELLNKLDEHREALYQCCLDNRLIEIAEERSKAQEQASPMTWTRELKTLADEIFGSSGNALPITLNTITTEPTRTADNRSRK